MFDLGNIMNLMMPYLNQMQNDPRIANNPNAREYIDVLRSGDQNRIQQLGQNICNSYNITDPNALIPAIMKFFGGR